MDLRLQHGKRQAQSHAVDIDGSPTSGGSETHLQGCVLAGCMPAPAGRPLRPLQHEVSTRQESACQFNVYGSLWPTWITQCFWNIQMAVGFTTSHNQGEPAMQNRTTSDVPVGCGWK